MQYSSFPHTLPSFIHILSCFALFIPLIARRRLPPSVADAPVLFFFLSSQKHRILGLSSILLQSTFYRHDTPHPKEFKARHQNLFKKKDGHVDGHVITRDPNKKKEVGYQLFLLLRGSPAGDLSIKSFSLSPYFSEWSL